MNAHITFTSGENVVTLPAPARREGEIVRVQSVAITAGGEKLVSGPGGGKELETLELESLTSAQAGALKAFFSGTVGGQAGAFSYADPAGTVRTARFAESALRLRLVAGGVFDVAIKLELA